VSELITVCIPSYKRPGLLIEAITSCFANKYRPLEITVGDDSPDNESERAVSALRPPDGVSLAYHWNKSRLGQPRNVNALFVAARGDRLILLHDDDRLLPGAIDILDAAWRSNPGLSAVFGKQQIIDMDGTVIATKTRELNLYYERTRVKYGRQPSALTSALLRQFPNNGYMIRTSIAQQVGYSDFETSGDACDFDFGVRVAKRRPELGFYFVDEFTAEYRETEGSISSATVTTSSHAFLLTERLQVSQQDEAAKAAALRQFAPAAVPELASQGRRLQALRVYFSRHYTVRRLSVKGLFHLATIFVPFVRYLKPRM
jgi:glycosyltransferase involved in cell wall biosynthesis